MRPSAARRSPDPVPAGSGQAALQVPEAAGPRPISVAPARDLALVARVLAGSQADFDELYEGYFPRVFRFALKRLGDAAEAEDVTQEVFETVFRVLPSYRGDASLLVWIFGITRNKVNRRFRGTRVRIESLDDSGADALAIDAAPTDATVDARRMLDRCDDVVAHQLTPLQRRIFHLKHLRSQPIRAIAQVLGKSEDAIKANLYRMRRTLADGAPGLEAFLN
jgi:RNA polymerase sigma-70 factor (ECF subfamily)